MSTIGRDASWLGGLALGDRTHIIEMLPGQVGGDYEVRECNADCCMLSGMAFWCCRASQDITLINVVCFSGSGDLRLLLFE